MQKRICFIFDCPSKDGSLMKGSAGVEFTRILNELQIDRNSPHVTFKSILSYHSSYPVGYIRAKKKDKGVINYNGTYVKERLIHEIQKFVTAFDPTQYDVVIGMGYLPLFTLLGETSIQNLRGSQHQANFGGTEFNFLPTYSVPDIFRRYELRFIVKSDIKRAVTSRWKEPAYNISINKPYLEVVIALHKFLVHLDTAYSMEDFIRIACDIETFRYSTISVIGLTSSSVAALVINFIDFTKPNYSAFTVEEETEIVLLIKYVLTHPAVRVAGQNFAYDQQYIAREWGFEVPVYYDTMLMWHTLYPGEYPKDLGFLASIYSSYYIYWKDMGKAIHDSIKTKETQDQYLLYNGYDAMYTYEIVAGLEQDLMNEGLLEVYEFQRQMTAPILQAMLQGTNYDTKRQGKMKLNALNIMMQYESFFNTILPESVSSAITPKTKTSWCRSPKQTMSLLYDVFRLPVQRNKKTKQPSSDDDALKVLTKIEPGIAPLLNKLLEYRSLGVFSSTFLGMEADHDGRMRTSYDLGGTETFRLASRKNVFGSGGNLQNIPKGTEE